MSSRNRKLLGAAIGICASVALGAVMAPLRPHINVATSGLVLILPVVAGVVVGGLVAGLVSVLAGFLVYDFLFVPPYNTLTVSSAQDWVSLIVYSLVMVSVAALLNRMDSARAESGARAENARQLFELSESLLPELTVESLAKAVVEEAVSTLGLRGAALLLRMDEELEVVAATGVAIDAATLENLSARPAVPVSLTTSTAHDELHTLALSTSGRAVGLLVMVGSLRDPMLMELMPTLANELALALERAQLHELALRTEVLEETETLRSALVGAVSHDLRTPLSTMKVAATTLLEPEGLLEESERKELYQLIDSETDRLDRLVKSLLDLTRLDAGVLHVRRTPTDISELTRKAVDLVRSSIGGRRVEVVTSEGIPKAEIDPLLITQVLTNLVENAHRHAPADTAITVRADLVGENLRLSVSDEGQGVPHEARESVFERFVGYDSGGRSGLGLYIAKTFVEAHGGRIWAEDATGGGAVLTFSVPVETPEGGA